MRGEARCVLAPHSPHQIAHAGCGFATLCGLHITHQQQSDKETREPPVNQPGRQKRTEDIPAVK